MMNKRIRTGRIRKSLSILLGISINILPLQGMIPLAHANTNVLNVPSIDQAQVLIILDNSQGMAGVIKGPDGLSGAIMSGSGTVAEDVSSSSPVSYQASSGFTPPAAGTAGSTVNYSVPCSSSSLSKLGQQACTGFGAGSHSSAYVDNSESMFNVSENAIRTILAQKNYADNIQFGLETYGVINTINNPLSLYNTWVYYMSASSGFSFGTSSSPPATSGLQAVLNPCFNSSSNSCQIINNYYSNYNYMKNLSNQELFNDKYLYVENSSDDPIINDVLYSTAGQSGSTNATASGPVAYYNTINNSYYGTPSNGQMPSTFYSYYCYYYGYCNNTYPAPTLSNYEQQNVGVNFSNYTNSIAAGMTPTSAGYFPLSQQLWESQRGYGFNASTQADSGNLVVGITASNASNTSSIQNAIVPEVLSSNLSYGTKPVTASAGHAPVAGAFKTALDYFQGTTIQKHTLNTTCGGKYVIFITDGQPTKGTGGHVYPPLGSASATTFSVTSVTSSNITSSSTNNAAVTEAISAIQALKNSTKIKNLDGSITGAKTYVIGVGSAVNPDISGTTAHQEAVAQQGQYVLQAMANAGGTNMVYTATSSSQLQSALNIIVANILGKSVVSSYATPPIVTVSSLEFLIKNINPTTGQGDLYAYPVLSNGSVSSTASWTANANMTAAARSTNLYTTPLGGTINGGAAQTFPAVASTNSAAFAISNTSLTANDIAQYTIDPSYNNGTYLGGRDNGWFVGLPSSAPAEVLTPPNNANLLNNSGYLSFASDHVTRQNAVLFSDNDGFLYALGYSNTGSPTLLWGWMPGALLPSLQNYSAFWKGSNMGNFQSIDASPNNGTNWHTYIVGVADGGSIYYDLQLKGTSAPTLESVVAQYSYPGSSQPQPSAPVFYQVNTPGASNFGETWALSAVNNSAGSNLGILNVTTGQAVLDALSFTNTATPYIDSNGNLFLGDSSGNVYEMSAANLTGILSKTSNYSIPSNDFTNIGNYAPWASTTLRSNVQFIGGTYYQGKNYLRVQGPSGITLFSQMNGTWSPVWTSYAGGAGTWSGSTYSTVTGTGTNNVSALPAGSTITDQALINNGNVIVPVTTPAASSDTCGESTAAYYIFGLGNGIFPSGTYTSSTLGTTISQGFIIGQGQAYTPSVTVFNGRLLLQGAASKNTTGGTSGFASAIGAGLPLGGPTAWRLVLQP